MAKIVYHTGQERDIVREKEAFADSIFNEQYKRAITLMSGFVDSADDNSLKIITFCGDRGEGKTSCMSTVIDILKYPDNKNESGIRFEDIEELSADCQHLIRLSKIHITNTRMIDPSFFDDHHNVLEIVIGQLYSEYLTVKDKYQYRAELETAFQNVKQSLRQIGRSQGQSSNYSDLYDLNDLAVTIELKNKIAELIKIYLQYIEKDILIIPIDDIDLSLDHTYEMCEQIRKYLCVPKCVVMMCAKIQLLRELIAKEFSTKFSFEPPYFIRIKDEDKENPIMDEAQDMAKKYLDKLIPASSRVNMPKAYDFGDVEIEIKKGDQSLLPPTPLKDCILELIFNRTRYLFYNPIGGISPIMPNNLRELFNLIGLLASMEPIGDASYGNVLKMNKSLFKGYFFSVWKDRFDSLTQESLDNLLNFDYGTSFNREVIKVLNNHFEERLKKDYHIENGDENNDNYANNIFNSIISPENFGYNVTTGDLFYLFSRLEKETLSESGYALLFFLKSLYSIKLYETYEAVTENNEYYPNTNSDNNGLTVIDHRFDHSNLLQQLTGGSFFTYAPGELIQKGRDLRVVEREPFGKLITELRDKYRTIKELSKKENISNNELDKINDFNLKLNIAELFILMVKCAVRNKHNANWEPEDILESIDKMRKNVEAYHFKSFHRSTGYYILDIMAPFANMSNPEFSYKRFWAIDDDFYNFIWNYNGSLLNQMVAECLNERNYEEDNDKNKKYHCLLSVAVIRNSEVLSAIKENIILKRSGQNEGKIDSIIKFYETIKKSNMATHKRYSSDQTPGKPYNIIYDFLSPIEHSLNSILNRDQEDVYRQLLIEVLFPDLVQKSIFQLYDRNELYDELYNAIIYKVYPHTMANGIHHTIPFNKLDYHSILSFINRTLPPLESNIRLTKDIKSFWLFENFDTLCQAVDHPEILTDHQSESTSADDTNIELTNNLNGTILDLNEVSAENTSHEEGDSPVNDVTDPEQQ